MPRNVTFTTELPHERLTRITDDMLQMLEHHPEDPERRVKCIILVDDMVDKKGGAALSRYEPGEEILAIRRLIEHATAIMQAHGLTREDIIRG